MTHRNWAAPLIVLAIALAVLAVPTMLALRGSNDNSTLTRVTGTGRGEVLATPGARLTGTILLARSSSADDVRWDVTAAGTLIAQGVGTTFQFTAPERGTAQLTARIGDDSAGPATRIRVVDPNQVLGSSVFTEGRVLVNGGPAVHGEALVEGTKVDARAGAISFEATARIAPNGLSGTIRLEGSALELHRTTASDGTVHNVVRMERSATTDEQLLVADVEHLDGTRYVEVETPDAVAMVKGTRFYVRLDSDSTDVAVDHGWVVVERNADAGGEPGMIDVRDEQETVVPRTVPDAAAPQLRVHQLRGGAFEDSVDTNREQMNAQVGAPAGPKDDIREAMPPKPPKVPITSPRITTPANPVPGTTAGGSDATAPPVKPNGVGTGTSGADAGSTTTRPPCGPPKCPGATNPTSSTSDAGTGTSTPTTSTTQPQDPLTNPTYPKPPTCEPDCKPPTYTTTPTCTTTTCPTMNYVPPPSGCTTTTCTANTAPPLATTPSSGQTTTSTQPTTP